MAGNRNGGETILARGEHEDLPSYLLFLNVRRVVLGNLVAKGLSDKEIAQSLCISPSAVKQHISSMLHEAGLHNRAEMAAVYTHLMDKLGLQEPRDIREW